MAPHDLKTSKRFTHRLVHGWLLIIVFAACGALTMTGLSLILLEYIPQERVAQILGIALGFLAIVTGADIGLRCWTYHAVRTGALREDVAKRILPSRKLPKAFAKIEWTDRRLVLMGGYIGYLAIWIPWFAVPNIWLWLLSGLVALFLASTVYALCKY